MDEAESAHGDLLKLVASFSASLTILSSLANPPGEPSDGDAVGAELVGADVEFWEWEWWGGLELDGQAETNIIALGLKWASSWDHAGQYWSCHWNSREVQVRTLYELEQPASNNHNS